MDLGLDLAIFFY